jgi:hypothetical protein
LLPWFCWKTQDGGKSWNSLFDKEGTLSIGSFAVAATDTNTIYLGTGEANIFRASIAWHGCLLNQPMVVKPGVIWVLENTSTISRVIIHPSVP